MMAFETIDDIMKVIGEQEGNLEALRQRMEDDYDLWSLVPYVQKDVAGNERKGYESYTSSAPRNFFDKILDGLNQAALNIQIKLPETASEKERREASTGELYLYGVLEEVDRRQTKRGEPPLRQSLGYFLCLRGWYGLRALVYLPKGSKETIFDVQPWDPLHITWEMGGKGLLWAARKVVASRGQILAEYGLTIKGKDAEVVDFWDEERNSVIIEGAWGKAPAEHRIGHVPVFVGPVGSMPTLQRSSLSSDMAATLSEQGESVYSAARGLFEPWNKSVSNLLELQKRAVVGSLTYRSRDGTKVLEGDPYQTWKLIPLAEDEEIRGLELPKAPPETAAILGLISQDLMQSTLPYPQAYGGTAQPLSGRALGQLADATRSVYNPRTEAMAKIYTWLCEELLSQFTLKGIQKTEVKGYRHKDFFQMSVKPGDIKTSWSVVVNVEPRMPRDEQEEIMMALAATGKRGPDDTPLMSKMTAREEILKMRDPHAEEDKVLEEMAEAMPPIMVVKIARALQARGKPDLAEQVVMLLKPQGAPAGPALPPELIETIVAVLVQVGQPQLAEAMLRSLGVVGVGPGSPPTVPPAGAGIAPGAPGGVAPGPAPVV